VIIQFPNQRPSPSPPSLDEELMAAHLDLLRVQASALRTEYRLANAMWVSYCVRKAAFWAVVLWVLYVVVK
jgi:hypothetical protein